MTKTSVEKNKIKFQKDLDSENKTKNNRFYFFLHWRRGRYFKRRDFYHANIVGDAIGPWVHAMHDNFFCFNSELPYVVIVEIEVPNVNGDLVGAGTIAAVRSGDNPTIVDDGTATEGAFKVKVYLPRVGVG